MITKLLPGEEVIYECRKHYGSILSSVMFFVLSFSFVGAYYLFPDKRPESYEYYEYIEYAIWTIFLLFTFILIRDFFDVKTSKYYVTNMRVINEAGVIAFSIRQSPVDKVGNTEIERGILGAMFNYGTLSFSTSSDMEMIKYKYMIDPLLFSEKLAISKKRINSTK